MATAVCNVLILSLCFSIFLNCCILSDGAKSTPDFASVRTWAKRLDLKWKQWISILTGYDTVQLRYQAASNLSASQSLDVHVTFEAVNGSNLVKGMSSDLSKMFNQKMRLLKKTVEVAEKAAAEHVWNSSLEKKDVTFYNSKEMQEVVLEYDDRFQQPINDTFSSVHIPVEIYEGVVCCTMLIRKSARDVEILNGLKWTGELDEAFEDNYQSDKEILWQYFGSKTGFIRTFPASSWKIHGKVDMYDVRRQSWYTQGSSSPKDMMILIDKSGSTHGQALQLMKVTVKSILDTLGENDFVNIVAFSQEAEFVSPCFNHTPFVQANHRNKQRLSRDVDQLEAGGMANYKVGLKFVFEQFRRFGNVTDPPTGSGCNKVIMLLTDGGTDNAEEIFKEYNWPNKTVRVFTYAIGPTANPTTAIRWMACANRGFFSQIPAMGAIRAKVQEYYDVLARPLALKHIEHTQWTSSHISPHNDPNSEYIKKFYGPMEYFNGGGLRWEITVDPHDYIPVLSRPQVLSDLKHFQWGDLYYDHLGLGMMTSVTLPVYNRTIGSSNQTILGVMGIDVTTEAMRQRTPQPQLGPNGYAFAINLNGYIIFHPNLKSRTYMKDPPDIDLLEIEINTNEKQQMRKEMINGRIGTTTLDTLILTQDMKYMYHDIVTYSFTPIEGTSFSLAISVPSYQKEYPKFVGKLHLLDPSLLKSTSWTKYAAPWSYYKNQSTLENETISVEDIAALLQSDPNVDHWNLQKLFHLYWDLKTVNKAESFSEMIKGRLMSNESTANTSATDGHILSFISTNGGLTQVFASRDNVSFDYFVDPMKEPFYQRAHYSNKYIFLIEPFSKGYEEDNSTYPPNITVVRSIPVTDSNKRIRYKAAVVGMKILYQHVLRQLAEASTEMLGNTYNCDDVDHIVCYLVDEGGFLIATNQEQQYLEVGKFLGKVDPPVMDILFNKSLYLRNKQYDFQGICYKNDSEVSAGPSSFRIPSVNLLFDVLNLNWWTTKLAWAYLNFNLFNWFTTSAAEVKIPEDENVYHCNVFMYQYYYGNTDEVNDVIICDNCTRKIMAVKVIENTNLLLVVTDPVCDECLSMYSPLPQEPMEITPAEEEDVICENAKFPEFRRQTKECYNYDPREDDTKCGGSSLLSVSKSQLLVLYVTMWMVLLLSNR